MKPKIAFFVSLLFYSLAIADNPPLVITEDGYYYIIKSDDGIPNFVKITQVLHLDDTRNKPDTDKPDTDKPDVDSIPDTSISVSENVKKWASSIKDFDNSQALALIYEQIALGLMNGDLNSQNMWDATKVMTDSLLKSTDKEKEWTEFREKLTSLIANKTAEGKLSTNEQIIEFYNMVISGLRSSVPESAPALNLGDSIQVMQACIKAIEKLKEIK